MAHFDSLIGFYEPEHSSIRVSFLIRKHTAVTTHNILSVVSKHTHRVHREKESRTTYIIQVLVISIEVIANVQKKTFFSVERKRKKNNK